MELRQIEYFLVVSRLKNFTRAAEELFVTQPTITIAIKNLEKEFGLPLFFRERGSLTLTEDGRVFLEYAEKIMNDAEYTIKGMAHRNPNSQKTLTLGIPTVTEAMMYPIVLNEYSPKFPQVELHLSDAGNLDVIKQIDNGELELGFVSLSSQLGAHFEQMPLARNQMSVIASTRHPFSKQDAVSLAELEKEDIIMYEKGESYTELMLEEQFRNHGLTLRVRHRIQHSVTLFEMVARNHGVSVILNDRPESVNSHPGIVIRPFEEPVWLETGLIWNKNKFLFECVKEFIRFMAQYAEQHP